jgi:hypothetical protein
MAFDAAPSVVYRSDGPEEPRTVPERYDIQADPLLEGAPVVEGYKVLGGVAVYAKLGQGGMGAVYKGRHLRPGIDVALKLLALPPEISSIDAEGFGQRMVREARAAATVRHANLVRVLDVNVERGKRYLVMDCVDGESAEDRLFRKGPLTEWEAVAISLGAAEGLAAATISSVMHGFLGEQRPGVAVVRVGVALGAALGLVFALVAPNRAGRSLIAKVTVGVLAVARQALRRRATNDSGDW